MEVGKTDTKSHSLGENARNGPRWDILSAFGKSALDRAGLSPSVEIIFPIRDNEMKSLGQTPDSCRPIREISRWRGSFERERVRERAR